MLKCPSAIGGRRGTDESRLHFISHVISGQCLCQRHRPDVRTSFHVLCSRTRFQSIQPRSEFKVTDMIISSVHFFKNLCESMPWNPSGFKNTCALNSWRSGCNSENGIFNLVSLIGIFRSSHDNALWWMPQDLTDDKSTLVQVMAWCRQATSHYLSQCRWPM